MDQLTKFRNNKANRKNKTKYHRLGKFSKVDFTIVEHVQRDRICNIRRSRQNLTVRTKTGTICISLSEPMNQLAKISEKRSKRRLGKYSKMDFAIGEMRTTHSDFLFH